MGKKGGERSLKADTITKDYISDTNVFADVFNYYIYGGEQVISPEQLEERNPTEIALPYGTDGMGLWFRFRNFVTHRSSA